MPSKKTIRDELASVKGKQPGTVIGIISGKGGVGKTTTTSNIGAVLHKMYGSKVVLIDANVSSASLALFLDVLYPPVTLNDVLDNKLSFSKVIYTDSNGIDLVPASLSLMNKGDIKKLRNHVKGLKETYEYILIDSAPGLGNEDLGTVLAADEVLVVVNPNMPSVVTAARAIEVARRSKVRVRGIVLNRVCNKPFELTRKEIEKSLETPIICTIPEDIKVPESIARKKPVALFAPSSPAAVSFKELAASLAGKDYIPSFTERSKKFFKKFIPFIS